MSFGLKKMSTIDMVRISLLAAVSFALMLLEFKAPIFPSFLKFDLSDLPAVLAVMMINPVAGIFVELVKNVIHFALMTSSGGIGEVANFIVGIAYVLPIGIFYSKKRNLTWFFIGATVGTLCMVIIACIFNYFILIPMYTKFMPLEAIIGMANLVNNAVVDMKTLILFSIAPFNLIKAIIISIASYFLYKGLKVALHL